jgi:transposase
MINVGIDLHKTQFTVCARDGKTSGFAKYPTTEEGYRGFLERAAGWQAKGEEVRVGVESTGNARHFRDRMEEAGIGVTVINTLKMKVINESVKKTDKHDAATIAEFLEKDILPEAHLCSRESEQLRRLLKAREILVKACVGIKNQIHGLLTSEGMEDAKRGDLQSKKGRQRVHDALKACGIELVAQPLLDTIGQLYENIKGIEKELKALTEGDRVVELLKTIPGCGPICAWTIRAYTDDIRRFSSPKKYASFAGLAPWVQNSNETIHHGRITKRGPKELRTALVQVVMGMRRMKEKLGGWRLTRRYEAMKRGKCSGCAIIATARKVAVIIWNMLTEGVEFDAAQMEDRKLAKKSESMRRAGWLAREALANAEKRSEGTVDEKKDDGVKKNVQKAGVASKKRKKVG